MAQVRGDRQSGAGTLEYVGAVAAAGLLITGLVLVFPSAGEQLTCRVSQAIGAITGSSVSCSGGSSDQPGEAGGAVPDSSTFSVVPRTTTAGPGTSRLEFEVDVPDGENWTVEADQPWVVVPDDRVFQGPSIRGFVGQLGGGNGPGSFNVVVHANPDATCPPPTTGVCAGSRTATLTFTGPDGQTFTQEITQPGGQADTVVLGDSFSAGNGSAKGHPDSTDDGECHRSSQSWGRLIEGGRTSTGAGTPNVSLTGFGACSGATVDGTNLKDGGNKASSLLAQIEANKDALADADQVAFSIGGNDIGFASIVQSCVVPINQVDNCHQAVREGKWRINGRGNEESPLRPQLEDAYRAALEAAPNATIYVVGYPPMVELDDTGGGLGSIKAENRQGVVDMLNDLNFQIESTVNMVNQSTPGGPRLVYVDPMADASPFHGHSLTDDDPYYHGLKMQWAIPPVSFESYHPNDAGNGAYADWIGRYMMGAR